MVGAAAGSREGLYTSWLVALVPAARPELVLVVEVYDGPPAPQVAAVIAGEVLAAWQQRRAELVSQADEG